ncbi:hypothetical protein DPMN_087010 [Dreissena polymorpha]|uniref:Uncharacterized protein n=1 Tax=Dreissena polymorpha TaxID=45954 RepID=A0A9D4KRG1_DREPO|nr:hypothetical protein DPMN_087010 [Dreissena polymorpha]
MFRYTHSAVPIAFFQDLRALLLIFSVQPPRHINKLLYESLHYILQVCREFQNQRDAEAASEVAQKDLDKSLECQTSADDRNTSRRRWTTSQESQESSEDTGICHLFLLFMHLIGCHIAVQLSVSPSICLSVCASIRKLYHWPKLLQY